MRLLNLRVDLSGRQILVLSFAKTRAGRYQRILKLARLETSPGDTMNTH